MSYRRSNYLKAHVRSTRQKRHGIREGVGAEWILSSQEPLEKPKTLVSVVNGDRKSKLVFRNGTFEGGGCWDEIRKGVFWCSKHGWVSWRMIASLGIPFENRVLNECFTSEKTTGWRQWTVLKGLSTSQFPSEVFNTSHTKLPKSRKIEGLLLISCILGNVTRNSSWFSFTIRLNLLHPKSSFVLRGLLLSLNCFHILPN